MRTVRGRRTVAPTAAALPAGLFSAPAGHTAETPRRVVENHTALRLCTTTEPTWTRLYTRAQNAADRLGRTVRGYLQSTYTDSYLGTETRRTPRPVIATTPRIASTEGAS